MKRGKKMEHSIKAGLMITSASDYNMEICRGANEACKELGIELVIFFGGSVDPNVEFVQSSDYQKANVYAFANYLDLDFLVIPASSICRTDQKTREAFPKYFHIPVVTLNSQIKDYPFDVYNSKKGVYNAVSYMIEKIIVNILELLLVMIVGLLPNKDLQVIKKLYQAMICLLKKNIFYQHLVIILIQGI